MNPKISVIIPTYNRAKILLRTIRSVLNQTFKDFELIIVDDGSTDNTKEVVEKFQKEDPRVKYIWQENSGAPAKPKNTGIKNSKGEYIAFLDDDDEWFPEKLEKQSELFKNSKIKNLGFVGCRCVDIYQKENKRKEFIPPKKGNIFKESLFSNVIHSCSSILIEKKVLDEIGFFDINFRVGEDTDLWIRIAEKYSFDFVDKPLFKYYIHGSNLSKGLKNLRNKVNDLRRIIKKHRKFYKINPKIYSTKLRNIGTLYLLNNEPKKARTYFIKAIEVAPWYVRSYFNLVVFLFGKKFYKKIFLFLKK